MYSSTYLSWFRRLLILGAVVAGLTASAAGARLDPGDGASAVSANQASSVSRPPDVSDAASAVSANQASFVSRPPDVQDAADSVSAVYPDVFERYAAAHPYGVDLASTELLASPPDVQDAATKLHATAAIPSSGGSGFAWDDWAIGIGTGLGLALLVGIGLMVGRQQRSRMQPV
jgi:hypothetical protein